MLLGAGKLKENHTKIANFLVISLQIIYTFFWSLHFFMEGNFEAKLAFLVLKGFTFALIALAIVFCKKTEDLGFLIPSIIAISLFITYFINDGVAYFYLILVGLMAFSGIYLSAKNFWLFALLVNFLLFLFVVLLGLPITGPNVSTTFLYAQWALLVSCSVAIYIIVRYATIRHNRYDFSVETFSNILASTPDIDILVDDKGHLVYFNNEMTTICDVEYPELYIDLPILDLFSNPNLKDMITDALDNEGKFQATSAVDFDGEIRHFNLVSTPIESKERGGKYIGIFEVTAIVRAKEEAENASRTKSDFLSKMSHEIRTPMNAITGMTELITYEDVSPIVMEYVVAIKQAGNHLLSIINDILDFSKVESGKLELVNTQYYFHSLVNDVISIIKMRMKDSSVGFSVYVSRNIPDELYGDELRIRQILLNILTNAVKYTKEGSVSLEITGKIVGEGSVDILVRVEDTGIGIKQDDIVHLFDEFAQFDMEKNRRVEGTGLGLPITYSLIKLMRGDILVNSVYGEGSTFTIILPQKFSQQSSITSVKDPSNKNVLLYCCSYEYVESITRSLKDLGVGFYVAENDVEAYYQLAEGSWDFVFVQPAYAENAKKAVKELNMMTKIVLVSKTWQVGKGFFGVLVMPAYYLNIANILNSTQHIAYETSRRYADHFVAPDARVLVVDDIDTNLKVAEGLMKQFELQIDLRPGGLEAIEAVQHTDYDIVFMDHMMPGVDGIEAMKAIRALNGGRYKDLPIVILTANAIAGTREMFLDAGFDDFLSKPIDVSKLHHILEKWIPSNKQQAKPHPADAKGHIDYFGNAELFIEGCDVNRGITLAGGSVENYLSILKVFHKDGYRKIEELESVASDIEMYTIIIHAIKSACANIGANVLAEEAKALEGAGARNDAEFIAARHESFIRNLQRTLASVGEVIKTSKDKNKYLNADALKEGLKDLLTALEEFDSNAIDQASDDLRDYVHLDDVGSALEIILESTLIGEYEQVSEDIAKLLDYLQ